MNAAMRPPQDLQTLLPHLRACLAEHGGVRLALLFGSWARATAVAHSDVDLAVDAPGIDPLALGSFLTRNLGLVVDIVPLTSASIPMQEALIRDGLVVHESEPGVAALWRSKTLAQLETDRPWYRRMRNAWLKRVAEQGL